MLRYNLKRKWIWNSVEVHAIYELVYLLCMNRNGLVFFRQYLSCQDQHVFEPYFMAQYLLSPVNTIVKSCLVPWMMKSYLKHKKFRFDARSTKAEAFMKYTVLVDLMTIVKNFGRKPPYKFEIDTRLVQVRDGKFGPKTKSNQNQVICALDSFMTIFLVTLPEKFKQWYNFQNSGNHKGYIATQQMNFKETPTFPKFSNDTVFTKLSPVHLNPTRYNYLPESWNLLECFNYFFDQVQIWTTPSIEAELLTYNAESKVEQELFPTSNDKKYDENYESEEEEAKEDEEIEEKE